MTYERIVVTQDNAEWAIRENLYRIYRVIQTKLQEGRENRLQGLDAGVLNKVYQVGQATEGTDAVTLGQVKAILGI